MTVTQYCIRVYGGRVIFMGDIEAFLDVCLITDRQKSSDLLWNLFPEDPKNDEDMSSLKSDGMCQIM